MQRDPTSVSSNSFHVIKTVTKIHNKDYLQYAEHSFHIITKLYRSGDI